MSQQVPPDAEPPSLIPLQGAHKALVEQDPTPVAGNAAVPSQTVRDPYPPLRPASITLLSSSSSLI
ncbi:hypothetical protein ASPZODRAFT_130449 [Penicilliopsis zonata CBS 506.65]|uniref:Uncharacterized protein n=1 Tax=Penicilliopsis zonata CBS 506.65 TaxID=1073090 RepID=A0A1L9SMZ6_9EURO|nr:hypothetical protein ASPZODRAFT_130449 [Penicilliopsis zonata CBS 506.65]OJJ48424.1 hypothetical protein ASPZODRAFT_130449 [Penicilliopsis zonata CBS 506.65]